MKRFCSMALAVLMIISILPMSVFAASIEDSLTEVNFTVIDNDQSTLAPGVTMNEVVLYNGKNQRVEMYVTTVDTTVDTVQVKANYKDNQNAIYGMQTLSDQVAAMEANYAEPFKIVAGINASYYNTTTGKPTGAFVMEGIDVTTESEGNAYSFFAVLKDGTYMIGAKDEYSSYKGQIQEAIGGYIHLVKDGAVVGGLNKTDLYPRQTLGLTADGKLILMTADGSQAPATVGLTIQEQAEVMLSLGCVEAIHLDGGNSATFGVIPEGSDKFVTKNSPSGGGERLVSNTLVIASTAVADGTFDHAVVESDYDYFLPYSTFNFSAVGADATNGPADIPEATVWALSDNSFGTIENGTFVSNGTLGDVEIQLVNNGVVVGSKEIHVVDPTSISFALNHTSVPYGKTVELEFLTKYGYSDVYFTDADFEYSVNPVVAGTMNGFNFTAAEESSITDATITATYKYSNTVAPATISVEFGKGSDILFNFEDGDISDWHAKETFGAWIDEKNQDRTTPLANPGIDSSNPARENSYVFLASEENGGHVRNGQYALGVRLDHTQADGLGSWIYDYLYYTGEEKVLRDVANGVNGIRLGMWVYSPGITNVCFQPATYYNGGLNQGGNYASIQGQKELAKWSTNYVVPESGWMYIYVDLTGLGDQYVQTFGAAYDATSNYHSRYPSFLRTITGAAIDDPEELVFYIDDITLDYSDATDDRDAPVISNAMVSLDGANDVALNGQTVNVNNLSFSATVEEIVANNMTGLNYSSAKIYVDGIDMSGNAGFKVANDILSLNNVSLTDGAHSITFAIFDNQGNETRLTKTLTVDTSSPAGKVYLTGHNDGNNTPKAGSVYYIDVKAADASKIAAITFKLKLNSAHRFEYDNIICADGVSVESGYDALAHELTLTIAHDGSLSGDSVLASIPVRVWSYNGGSGTPPILNIECKTTYGDVTYTNNAYDSYAGGFYTALNIATEHIGDSNTWSALHTHTVAALDDKDATCTKNGYTGRTYCADCASVVDWGTTLTAFGHNWVVNEDDALACVNGRELFNGVYTDGKTYVDGYVVSDGWVEVDGVKTYYYVDGVKLTGSHWIDNNMYTFDENGVYLPNYIHDGWYDVDDTVMYFVNNKYTTGYMIQNYKPYFFGNDGKAFEGEYVIDGKKCIFDNGRFSSCEDAAVIDAGWCGEDLLSVEYMLYADGTIRITGEGNMMNFAEVHYVPWFDYTITFIKSVFIDKEISKIGNHAFRNCFVATSLTFEEGSQLTYIGMRSFHNMRRLTSVVLPEGVETIRWSAFGYSYKLENIYMPSTLTTIEDGAFVKTNTKLVMNVEDGSVAETFATTNSIDYVTREKVLKNGIIEEGGKLYYYVDGARTNAGLVKVDGYYYYASTGGVCKTGKYWVSRTNDMLPAGYYFFNEDGKMDIKNGVYAEDGGLYYYVDGVRTGAGLVKVDGYYYYASTGGVCKTGKYWVSRTNDLPIDAGYYYFDTETGRMDIDIKNGVYAEDGGLYYYVDGVRTGAGLVKVDGYYYYASTGGVCKTGKYWVSRTNDMLPAGYYFFNEDGKMDIKNGVYAEDGGLYYYVDGVRTGAGLVKVDGYYYYASTGGVCKTGKYWVSRTNDMLPAGYYTFDTETGKMIL